MYLKVGGRLRPFNEARAGISYLPRYDARQRAVAVEERWEITGRVVLETVATQTRMTQALRVLESDFNQPNPDLEFIEDDGSTPSFFRLLRSDCIDGPKIVASAFPQDQADIYSTGTSYSITMVGVRPVAGSGANVVLEFSETWEQISGGRKEGYVGGAINYPERQVFKQHEAYTYVQRGSAVGLYGYIVPPAPLFPFHQTADNRPVYVSPRVIGKVNTEYELSWIYEFASDTPLVGRPHEII